MIRFGIDLGGTKIEIVALSHEGRELLRHRIATPHEDYGAILHGVADLVAQAERELGERGSVGIGTPGSISRATGLLRGSNSICLNGKAVKADFEAMLGREVRISNDANCFALSEACDGAGKGAETVFGAILGTGVGGGIVVNGSILVGPNGIAGEWGHNPLPWPTDDERPGPRCFCGHTGCIETFVSGPGIERDYFALTGEHRSSIEIDSGATNGDRDCERVMQRYEQRLARALAHMINIVDPDTIVLGGGMSNVQRLYKTVPALWTGWVFSDRVDTLLVRNEHGDSSGVRGAAWLWPDKDRGQGAGPAARIV